MSPLDASWNCRPRLVDAQLFGIVLVRSIAQARRPARKTALVFQGGNLLDRASRVRRIDDRRPGRVYLLLDGQRQSRRPGHLIRHILDAARTLTGRQAALLERRIVAGGNVVRLRDGHGYRLGGHFIFGRLAGSRR